LRDDDNGVEAYLKNEIVFGLDRVLKWDKYDGTLNILEGEFNTIVMQERGYRNTVGINGSYFGLRQIQLIKRYAERAVLFFDSDQAGYHAVHAVAEALLPFMYVDVCPDHVGDPADMHPYTLRRCVAGKKSYREVMLSTS
jgi:DNA primase